MTSLSDRLAHLSPEKQKLLAKLMKDKGVEIGRVLIPRRPVAADPPPVSFNQRRLWFLQQLDPRSSAFNIPSILHITGDLHLGALASSFSKLLERHEVLRTTYSGENAEPVQKIHGPRLCHLPVADLSGLAASERMPLARQLAAEETSRPFDLGHDPVWRLLVLRLSSADHVILFVLHHIATDEWSSRIFSRELGVLYQGFRRRRPAHLPELPIQYADYAWWQRQFFQGQRLAERLEYWRRQLADVPSSLELPTDRPRGAEMSLRAAIEPLILQRGLVSSLETLRRKEGTTRFNIFLTTFGTLLSRYCGESRVLIGVPMVERQHRETEGLIGCFINMLVIRIDLTGDPSFQQLLRQVRGVTLEARTRQEIPFEVLVHELQPERALNRSPLVQVVLNFEEGMAATKTEGGPSAMKVQSLGSGNRDAEFDLTLSVAMQGDEVEGGFKYRQDLFDRSRMIRMTRHLALLLERGVTAPELALSQLSLLTVAEEQQLLVEPRSQCLDFPSEGGLVDLFAATVARRPAAPAVVEGDGWLSYGELDRRAARLACQLRQLGVRAEVPVGLYIDPCLELVIATLAILKAGGAYLPLDRMYPKERLRFMLEDAACPLLVTRRGLVSELEEVWNDRRSVVCVEDDFAGPVRGHGEERHEDFSTGPENLAYVIYTSGSTGQPKGALVTHRNACRLLAATERWFQFGADDTWTLFHSHAFDFSVWELWGALAYGGRLVIVPHWVRRSRERFTRLLEAQKVTVLNQTPSAFRELVQEEEALRSGCLRLVIFGGEALVPQSLGGWIRGGGQGSRPQMVNMYGITETCVHVTYRPLSTADSKTVGGSPIGEPISDLELFLFGPRGELLPYGIAGELCVGGPGLARGYLRRPGLTALRFVPHPHATTPGQRLYRSGDLAVRRADGDLEYLGRIDHQVQLRGFRVELGEIEARLHQHPQISAATVVVWDGQAGGQRLVAYVVSAATELEEESQESRDWRNFLLRALPDYMVPNDFIELESLPLTPNGKVDRKALPEPERKDAELRETFVAPRTPTEEILADLWAEILGLERVGIHNNFFELGGHSLLAMQVMSRLGSDLGVEVPVRLLFESPTVAGLAARWEQEQRASSGMRPRPPLVSQERPPWLPLSFAQQRLWFLDQLEPGQSMYNLPFATRIHGALRLDVLKQVVTEIVRRHEVLRTRFATVAEAETIATPEAETPPAGAPVQVIEEAANPQLPVVDLSALGRETAEALATKLVSLEAVRPFDLARGPLLRLGVVRLAAEDHVLLATMHHIVSDGWSLGVLMREVKVLSMAFAVGRRSPLPELSVQYADYALWQRQWLQGEVYEAEVAYWRRQLSGAPPLLRLPLDRPRPARQSFRGRHQHVSFSPPLSSALKAFGRSRGATLFMTLLAGFQLLLSRLSGQQDISVGTPIAGRQRKETEHLIGFFVNTLVLRTQFSAVLDSPAQGFEALLAWLRETCLDAHAHQELPFEEVVDTLQPERNLSHSPLFQAMFILHNVPTETAEIQGLGVGRLGGDRLGMETSRAPSSGGAKFDLTLAVEEGEDQLHCLLEAKADLFDATTVERWGRQYITLLSTVVENPELPLSQLSLLSPSEEHALLVEYNDTAMSFPPSSDLLHGLLAATAERRPESMAVVAGRRHLSYRELVRRGSRLAHCLRCMGVCSETPVGLYSERSCEMVVGMVAVLEAGGAYLPLDPSYPTERLTYMLEDSGVQVLLSTKGRGPGGFHGEVLVLDHGGETPDAAVASTRRRATDYPAAENPVYILYTSGSTGRPKGVVISHRAICNYLLWMQSRLPLSSDDRLLQKTSFGFDPSMWEVWAPLLSGASLIMAPPGTHRDPRSLIAVLDAQRITLLRLVPSLLRLLVEEPDFGACGPLRCVLSGGEALSSELQGRFHEVTEEVDLLNVYGPTEATINASISRLQAESSSGAVSIGRALGNVQLFLLNGFLQPVPRGASGVLHIGGSGLARGYLGRPALTAERFLPNPLGEFPGGRLYNTGDLAHFLPDGRLEFEGRTDHQVKVRGFRIELGEVETVLARHPEVGEVVVGLQEDSLAGGRLVAYVVAAEGGLAEEGPSALREYLGEKLPHYMVPSRFVFLEVMPQTPNGKVNRKALPVAEREQRETGQVVEPRDVTELRLATLWKKILGVELISIKDNFFDIGGHSLLAVQLKARIEQEFDTELPLAVLFRHSTVEALASWLRQRIPYPVSSTLVTLRSGGSRSPLFLIHPAGGTVFCYLPLAHALKTKRPVYALQARGIDGEIPPLQSFQEMAANYIEEMESVQPEGPYLLGGWSLGGLVAFEMAQQLSVRQKTVDRVLLLDSVPNRKLPWRWLQRRAGWAEFESFAMHLGFTEQQLTELAPNLRKMAPRERVIAALESAKTAGLFPVDLGTEQVLNLFKLFRANLKAHQAYRPRPYSGRLSLIQATEAGEDVKVSKRWRQLAGKGLDLHQVHCDHFSILKPPHLEEVAAVLDSWLLLTERDRE